MTSLGVFFDHDIRAVLLALHQTIVQSGADGEFLRGYETALIAVALAHGVELETTQLHIPSDSSGGQVLLGKEVMLLKYDWSTRE